MLFCVTIIKKLNMYKKVIYFNNSIINFYHIHLHRVSCSYPNYNITIKIDESSDYPYYLAFVIWYQQGQKDITAVQLCEVSLLYIYVSVNIYYI